MNVVRKARTAIKNPGLLRNYVFGLLQYYPTTEVPHFRTLPIYCISMAKAVKRRRFIERQVKKAKFENFTFLEAVDASSLSYEQLTNSGWYDDEEAKRYQKRSLRLNVIACSLSHGLAYETICRARHPLSLIVEDDAIFVSDQINKLDIYSLPNDMDVLFLNSFFTETPPRGRVRESLYSTDSWCGSTCAYLVTLAGAAKLAKAYKPVIHSADGLLGRCMLTSDLQHPFKQQGATTTIVTYLIYPDCVLNGSCCKFYTSEID